MFERRNALNALIEAARLLASFARDKNTLLSVDDYIITSIVAIIAVIILLVLAYFISHWYIIGGGKVHVENRINSISFKSNNGELHMKSAKSIEVTFDDYPGLYQVENVENRDQLFKIKPLSESRRRPNTDENVAANSDMVDILLN